MKRVLFLLLLTARILCAAPGDIVSLTVRADSWSADLVISGLSDAGAYDNGFGANNTPGTGAKMVLTVAGAGYLPGTTTSGTNSRYVLGTAIVRKAYPDNALNDETESGGNLTVRIALSERIYSGETVTAMLLASFYTEAGGDGGTASNTATGLSCTNNSSGTAPVPIMQWDEWAGVGQSDKVTTDFYVAVNADVAGPGAIAAVRFDCTGRTSSHVETVTVGMENASVLRSATGQSENCYRALITVSGFTVGELIDLRARVYPTVGSTAFDTDSFTTATEEVRLHNKATIVYASTPKYAYIDLVSGSNSNTGSTTWLTAFNNPIQHIGKGIQNDCDIIICKDGQTHPILGTVSSTRRTTNQWYIVQPEGAGFAEIQFDASARTQRCERLQFNRCRLTMSAANAYMDGNADTVNNHLKFTNCDWVNGGTITMGGTSAGVGYNTCSTRIYNSTGDLSHTSWRIGTFSTTRKAIAFDGVVFFDSVTATSACDTFHRLTACRGTGAACFGTKSSSNPSAAQDRFFVHNNRFTANTTSSANWFNFNATSTAITEGFSLRGNLVEMTSASVAMGLIGADSSVAAVNKVIVKENTFAIARWNMGYNDLGSAAWDRLDWSVRDNIFESANTKHDTFPGNSQDGARIGGWPVLYGVGFSGNVFAHITGISAAGSFMWEFPGVNSYQPTLNGSDPPGGTPNATTFVGFVDRRASPGGGDYHLKATSPALLLPAAAGSTDSNGNPRFYPAAGARSYIQSPITSTGASAIRSTGASAVRK